MSKLSNYAQQRHNTGLIRFRAAWSEQSIFDVTMT